MLWAYMLTFLFSLDSHSKEAGDHSLLLLLWYKLLLHLVAFFYLVGGNPGGRFQR
jgi:hypothetical protein